MKSDARNGAETVHSRSFRKAHERRLANADTGQRWQRTASAIRIANRHSFTLHGQVDRLAFLLFKFPRPCNSVHIPDRKCYLRATVAASRDVDQLGRARQLSPAVGTGPCVCAQGGFASNTVDNS